MLTGVLLMLCSRNFFREPSVRDLLLRNATKKLKPNGDLDSSVSKRHLQTVWIGIVGLWTVTLLIGKARTVAMAAPRARPSAFRVDDMAVPFLVMLEVWN